MKKLVQSYTHKGMFYEVDAEAGSCTCPAFRYGKGPCKHLKGTTPKPSVMDHDDVSLLLLDDGLLKSAIQKAFRRNDQKTLGTLFDYFWDTNRSWVMWRYMVWPLEDSWRSTLLMGQAKYQATLKANKHTEATQKQMMRDALLEAAGCQKDQDGNGLRWLAQDLWEISQKSTKKYNAFKNATKKRCTRRQWDLLTLQFKQTHMMMKAPEKKVAKKKIWQDIWEQVESHEGTPDYQTLRDAVGAAYFRGLQGGDPETQMLFVAVANLILDSYTSRGDGSDLKAHPSATGCKVFDEKGLKWYCLDMHTGVGKRVLRYVCKVYPDQDPRLIENLWFVKTTAKLNQAGAYYSEAGAWWSLACRLAFARDSMSLDAANTFWDEQLEPMIRQKVEEFR